MKTNKFIAAALVAAGLFSTGALAQTPAPSSPSTEVVYVPQLPAAAELTKAAAAQNITVERIDQTANQVTVTYKYPNGQENTVSYQPLSAAATTGAATPSSAAPAVAGAPATTTVVYTSPYYYDYPYYPYYYGWYPPVAVGIGFGWHGGWGWHGGGGFRR